MSDYTAAHYAIEVLPLLGPDAVPVMLSAATNLQGSHYQWELIRQFGTLGTNGVPAIPALVAWSRDSNSWVRLGAAAAMKILRSAGDDREVRDIVYQFETARDRSADR